MRPDKKFDWNTKDAVAVREQAAIAVFTDQSGNVVIRQAGQYGPEEDMWVVLAPENACALAEAIMRETVSPSPISNPIKPKTDAERQRAYRERKRNAAVTPTVTQRDTERHGDATGQND